jgi:hypothetical protein
VLKVEHVLVVGHYGCGGIAAADLGRPLGLIDNWLRHIQDVAERHRRVLERAPPEERLDRLTELNVLEQAFNVCRTSTVQEAWGKGQAVEVHGWIYRLSDGLVQDLGFCASQTADPAGQLTQAIAHLEQGSRPAPSQDLGVRLMPDQLKLLIARGLAQGHLTYEQLGEELPPGLAPTQIEEIIGHLADLGVRVHERDPDA